MNRAIFALCTVYALCILPSALAQDFPSKPIRVITSSFGGGADFAARVAAQGMAETLGQQVVVDNRAGGLIAIEAVAKAPPDGYSLLVDGTGLWVGPLLRRASYDTVRDFSPVALIAGAPNILVVHPSLPVKTVQNLIDLAKRRPNELNYGSTGVGGSAHLAVELFKSMTRAEITHVPYKSVNQAMTDLVGGQIHLVFPAAAAASPHIKSGRLRALAVTSGRPSALFPDLPTVTSTVPGYEVAALFGILAPARTPTSIIAKLNQAVVQTVNRADVKQRFLNSGAEVIGGSPEQFAATINADVTKWEKVIKDAAIKVE